VGMGGVGWWGVVVGGGGGVALRGVRYLSPAGSRSLRAIRRRRAEAQAGKAARREKGV